MIIYIKSKSEISGFTKAGEIASKVMDTLIGYANVGTTTKELDSIANEECRKYNVVPTFLNYRGFPASICTSVNKVLVHGIPTDYKLKDGDILSIDVGITQDGFIGDIAKTLEIGSFVDNMVYECRRSLNDGIECMRHGNKMSDIVNIIYKIARSGGYSIPIEYGGHGIDRNKLHASPFIPNNPKYLIDFELRSGMILAIEPMFILGSNNNLVVADNKWDVTANSNTAHFEHTILVTDSDPLILTEDSS